MPKGRRIPVLALCLCLQRSLPAAASMAGGAGSSSAVFLSFGQGPRAIGMGESQTAAADDAYAAFWNPAGLALVERRQAALTDNIPSAQQGVNVQYFSLAWPLRPGSTLDLNYTRLGMSAFDAFDAQGVKKTGSVGAEDQALGLAYAHGLVEDLSGRPLLSVGANIKAVRERLDDVSAATFAADLGALQVWRPDGRDGSEFRLGATAQNLGGGLKFDGQSSPLPAAYRLGEAWILRPKGDALTLSLDEVFSREEGWSAAAGLEYAVWRMLALRVGWRLGQDVGLGLRAGVGFKLKVIDVDYAFAGFGTLGQMHRVGLLFRFGGPVETTPPEERSLEAILKKAARLMSERRYYEAVLEYNEALERDPGNRAALEGMKRANQALH